MIEIGNKKSNVEIQYPSFTGSDGGYYKPTVSEDGLLEWIPTSNTMPAVQAVNIKGPQGDKGNNGVYVGTEEPTDVEVWINPQEMPDFIVTMEEVTEEVERQLEGKNLDLSDYYSKTEVDAKIEAIEIIQGPQGETGPAGKDGYSPIKGTDYWTEEDKSEIIDEILTLLPEGGGEVLPASEEVEF